MELHDGDPESARNFRILVATTAIGIACVVFAALAVDDPWLGLVVVTVGPVVGLLVAIAAVGRDRADEARRGTPPVRITGTVVLSGLPPNLGLSLSMAFFKVDKSTDPAPFGADPVAEEISDVAKIYENVDMTNGVAAPRVVIPIDVLHQEGIYYLQLRGTLYRRAEERVLAQVETAFFGRRPLSISREISGLELPFEWPETPVADLHHYVTLEPTPR